MAATQAPPPPPQWVLDLNSTAPKKPRSGAFADPPGYNAPLGVSKSGSSKAKSQAPSTSLRKAPTTEEMDTLKLKKAWELAIAPAKQLPMSAVGMYMTGNTLQIFSIFMLFTLFKTPIQALLNIQNVFARFETDGTRQQMLGVKLVYVAMNLVALSMGIWKVNGMGLLPTTSSDWLAWETAREPLARAYPAHYLY